MSVFTKLMFVTVSVILFTFTSCQPSDSEIWAKIKQSKRDVYPAVSVRVIRDSVLHQAEVTWLVDGYKDYPYKKYCNSKTTATFDISQREVSRYLGKDSLGVAYLLIAHLQSSGVAHFVAQTLISNKLLVYIYYDEDVNPFISFSDFIIPGETLTEHDGNWGLYGEMLMHNGK